MIHIKTALKAMSLNKVRTSLTVLGIVIGIASVIIVYSAGEGISSLITGQIESFGSDFIETEVKVPTGKKRVSEETQGAMSMAQGLQITTLNLDDMDDINRLPSIVDSYAGLLSQDQVSYGNEVKKIFLFGTSASYIDIDNSRIGSGRFFTESEDKSLAQVAIIGSKIKEKLFGESDAIGKSIKIKKTKFKVIGVMEERGAVMTLDFDDYIYIPIRTLQKKLMGVNHVLYMVHKVKNMDMAEVTADEIRFILRENHNISAPSEVGDISKDDFRVVTMTEMMEMLDVITGAITLLLLAIVIISIIVGGVGIMNIMYVIVSERTSEIGLRKAVGAKFKDIMSQFIVESILITVIGGLIGIFIGILFSYLISVGANYFGLDWRFSIPYKAYFVAFGFSLVFGVIFGVYPAAKAARMEPVEALRKE
jgi:putative ABC transport system permease protein